MEDLIENAQILFDEFVPPSSRPLPLTPGGEPVPVVTYGSSHTMVALPQTEVVQADFTPQLPPRPTNSIHPSARSNPPMSPSRLSMELSPTITPPRPPSPPTPTRPLRVEVPAEQLARSQVVADTSSTEVAGELLDRSHLLISPLDESASEQRQQQAAVESAPNTPLTASSQTSSTSSGPR